MFKLQTDRQAWPTVKLADPDGEIRSPEAIDRA